MTLSVEGFYDADDVNTQGKITHIVGSGQANKSETVFYNGTDLEQPLHGRGRAQLGQPDVPRHRRSRRCASIQTGALPQAGSSDCLTWAAVVYRTPLNDDDEDGLLNRWETSTEPIKDPYGRTLPPLVEDGRRSERQGHLHGSELHEDRRGADVWRRACSQRIRICPIPRRFACSATCSRRAASTSTSISGRLTTPDRAGRRGVSRARLVAR